MRSPDASRTDEIFGKRYRAERLLKSGQGIDTWLGVDTTTGAAVVIKETDAAEVSPGTRLRLEHEAQVLQQLAGASLTSLLHVEHAAETFYVVMPYVPGITLAERLTWGPLSIDDALAVGRGLMRALQAAHDHGVLHRDVKPANIIVGDRSPPEPVTLIDFGLSRSARLDASLRDLPVGTVAYVSPEQAGLIHREVGETSDLYSAGIVLFECLAGRVPFSGSTVSEILRQHVTDGVPDLRRLGIAVPRALAEVIQRLVRIDPRDRYGSAAGALADLDEIADALGQGRRPTLIAGAHDRRRTLTEPAFVGRDEELRGFEHELDLVTTGAARTVVLEGESGSGKSRLLDEVAVTSMHRGAWVLRGGATKQTAPRPLQILDGVAHEIVAATRDDPGLAAALRGRLGEHAMAIAAALPRLRTVLAPGRLVSLGPEANGEARSVPALIALLDALGSAARPAVVLLDDCQWADELSLKLLRAWQSAGATSHAGGSTAGRVLLVAAFRPEEVGDDSPLRRLEPSRRIVLGPLVDRDVRRFAESMSGALPGDALGLVVRLSDGNPFLARAVLEGLVEGGALIDTERGWDVEPHAMAHAQSSRRAAVFLERSIEGLPPNARALLSVGAVLGKTFGLKLAADLSGQTAGEAMASVTAARRRHLVWIDAHGAECVFVHDRIRDNLLGLLSPADQRRLHGEAAVLLSEGEPGPDLAFDLAYHFDAAGEHARALPHALRAAALARSQHALEIAEGFYRIAARGTDESDAATRREVCEGLGDVLLLRGRYDEAGRTLRQARALAESKVAEARIEGKLGELAFKHGDVHAAEDATVRALSLLGRSTPTRSLSLALATVYQVLVQLAHTLLPRRLVARRRLDDGAADLLAMRLYSRLAYVYWFNRGQVATFWAHLHELNLAERYPPTRELAQACSEHAISVTGLPRILFRRGVRYAERGMAIRRALGDVWGEGQSLNFHGILLYAFGRYVEALHKFRAAERVLDRTGDRWEANIAGFHIAFCLFRLGELRRAIDHCQRVYGQGAAIGDAHAMATVLEVWSKASGGAVSAELIASAMRRSESDPQAREFVLQAEGVRLLGAGRPADGAAMFAAAETTARAARLRNEYVSYAPLWTAHALRRAAVNEGWSLGVPAPERLRAAERALRRGMRLARRYRGHLPMALRERALLRAMRGRREAARRDLDRSVAAAAAQGARLEVGLSLLARGDVGRLAGWVDAPSDTARARSLLFDLGAEFALTTGPASVMRAEEAPRVTLSLADRFNTIVDEGFRIASALRPAEIRDAVCAAARKLLRSDVVLLPVPDAPDTEEVRELTRERSGLVGYSRSLVLRALAEGQPVVEPEPGGRELAESLILGRVRSAVCAPILSSGSPVACLYAIHRGVGALFGEDEQRIARLIATLAGASLEKAAAFARLQELSQSLERRVEDRTSQLTEANLQLDHNLRRLRDTQDQLVHAAKMAAIGTLVAGLSHELNNPIHVILGYTQSALHRMAPDDPLRRGMVAMERQASRCADLVGTLLDFSRKGPVARHDLAVDDLVGRVAQLEAVRLTHGGVNLMIAPSPPDLPRVAVSRTEIESALLNLVHNAVDASPPGGTVWITTAATRHDGRSGVTIAVRDEGPGIPAEMIPQIFDPFFTTKPAGSGTGLGLPISRQFVEAHGGVLSVESELGRGTTMKLWLPASSETSMAVAS